MSDAIFVIAGYGVILGGLAAYAGLLLRRLAAVRGDADPPISRASDPEAE